VLYFRPVDDLGPIDFVAVAFPQGRVGTEGFDRLLDLADRGVISILDVEFVAKDADGNVAKVGVDDVKRRHGVDLGVWDGASSGLLDDEDVADVGASLEADDVAAVVIFENRWVLGLVESWRKDGARLVADGGLAAQELVAALDATETD
jgi:Family of unknown function (DUF6325)